VPKWEICSLLGDGKIGVGGKHLNPKGDWESLSGIAYSGKFLWTLRLFRGPGRGTGVINGSSSIRANARCSPEVYFKVC